MEALKFTLSGDFGFFKDPHRNDIECSYPHIHKPNILGMCGAIMGMRGRESDMQYYKELHSMGVSIVPRVLQFDKYIEEFVNATGFANKDGFSQMLRRQILVNPSWDIYLKKNDLSDEVWDDLKRRLIEKDYVYEIGLGRKTYFADIEDVELCELKLCDIGDDVDTIDSICYNGDIGDDITNRRLIWTAPVDLYEICDKWEYVSKKLLFTNNELEDICEDAVIYKCKGSNICFL